MRGFQGPCLCGDPECPWCGTGGPDVGDPPENPECEGCHKPLPDASTDLCEDCLKEVKQIIRSPE